MKEKEEVKILPIPDLTVVVISHYLRSSDKDYQLTTTVNNNLEDDIVKIVAHKTAQNPSNLITAIYNLVHEWSSINLLYIAQNGWQNFSNTELLYQCSKYKVLTLLYIIVNSWQTIDDAQIGMTKLLKSKSAFETSTIYINGKVVYLIPLLRAYCKYWHNLCDEK